MFQLLLTLTSILSVHMRSTSILCIRLKCERQMCRMRWKRSKNHCPNGKKKHKNIRISVNGGKRPIQWMCACVFLLVIVGTYLSACVRVNACVCVLMSGFLKNYRRCYRIRYLFKAFKCAFGVWMAAAHSHKYKHPINTGTHDLNHIRPFLLLLLLLLIVFFIIILFL